MYGHGMPDLNAFMEIDHVIAVHADGTVTDGPAGIYAPDLMHVDGAQHPHDVENVGSQGWELLTGFTGQHGYSGAVLHSSEFVGGGLERHILANPGLYVATVVNCYGEPECQGHADGPEMGVTFYCDGTCGGVEEDPEPAGWAVAYMSEPPEPAGV